MKNLREYSTRGTADCPFSLYHMIRRRHQDLVTGIHWHPEAEILYMRRGAVELRSGRHTFTLLPGYIAFVPPGELHTVLGLEDASVYEAMVFSLELLTLPRTHFFQRELVQPLGEGNVRFPYLLLPEDPLHDTVSQSLDRVCACPRDAEDYKLTVFLELVQIFSALKNRLEPHSDDALRKGNAAVKACLMYMEGHFAEHLTLADIAHQVHLHPNYLCGLFKDYTGQTVFQNLIRIRVEKAAALLRESDISVGAAAAACGFDSTGFFTGKFRAIMGITPKAYSLRHRGKNI